MRPEGTEKINNKTHQSLKYIKTLHENNSNPQGNQRPFNWDWNDFTTAVGRFEDL